MAQQAMPLRLRPLSLNIKRVSLPQQHFFSRRYASTDPETTTSSQELNPPPPLTTTLSALNPSDPLASELADSSHMIPGPSPSQVAAFNPVLRARRRNLELPPSRYRFRPPRYYRGPLHPHQPPPRSDPSSREYIPGPFSLPRFQQTYSSTLAPDLMTLAYKHVPPLPDFKNTEPPLQRLRPWVGESPYFANRPLRAPRGGQNLPLLVKPIHYHNIPRITRITVSAIVRQAGENSAYLHVAGMVLQAMTGQRAQVHIAKKSQAVGKVNFNQRAGKPIALSAEMKGEQMWHFLGQLVEVVGPGVKEWRGMRGSSGDGSGNLGVGFGSEVVGAWPEVEVNYDSYPPQMIPGVDIIVHTTATNDRDARLLLSGTGLPFYGKHKN